MFPIAAFLQWTAICIFLRHNGDLYCIDINTHKPVWNKNIWTDFGGAKLHLAITQNPLIYGNLVIVSAQAPEAG